MVDGVQVAFPHDHELVFERLLFRNALCPECLVLDFNRFFTLESSYIAATDPK